MLRLFIPSTVSKQSPATKIDYTTWDLESCLNNMYISYKKALITLKKNEQAMLKREKYFSGQAYNYWESTKLFSASSAFFFIVGVSLQLQNFYSDKQKENGNQFFNGIVSLTTVSLLLAITSYFAEKFYHDKRDTNRNQYEANHDNVMSDFYQVYQAIRQKLNNLKMTLKEANIEINTKLVCSRTGDIIILPFLGEIGLLNGREVCDISVLYPTLRRSKDLLKNGCFYSREIPYDKEYYMSMLLKLEQQADELKLNGRLLKTVNK